MVVLREQTGKALYPIITVFIKCPLYYHFGNCDDNKLTLPAISIVLVRVIGTRRASLKRFPNSDFSSEFSSVISLVIRTNNIGQEK